jgi:tetratricopeptide (TPR) repeat protein
LLLLFLLLLLAEPGSRQAAALLQRGLVALQQGQLRQAQSDFKEAAKLEPDNAYVWASLAETQLRLGARVQAAAAAEKAEKAGKGNPLVSHALGIYYSEAGDFRRAARLEQSYAESGQPDPAAFVRVGELYLAGGDAEGAARAARRATEIQASAESRDLLGRALMLGGQPEAGMKELDAAWNAAPSSSAISFHYAQALLQKEDFTRAVEVVQPAIEAHPGNAQLTLILGVARYGQRRFAEAIAAFLQVIQIDPQIEQPYRFLGKMIDQAGGRLTEITAAYEKWAQKNPKSEQAQLLLAKARLAADSKDATAAGLLRRAIALGGEDWEVHYELGVLLENRHRYKEAEVELARSAALDSKQAAPHYHLARVYDRLGDSERARTERETHQRLSGTTP